MYLNVKCKRIKLLTGENLHGLRYGDDLLDTPQIQSMKKLIDKLDFIKIKNCSEKGNVKKMRRQATNWKNICKDTTDKGQLSKIYETLKTHQ